MALDFPSNPSTTDVHNAANGLQYVFDGVKWVSQGRYDTGAINAEKLDDISSNFNGVLTTFNLKVNNVIVKPASAESLHIVLAGHLQEPSTAYTINSANGTITFASAPSNGTAFFGVVLSRLPIADTTGTSTITNANVAANAAIDGTKINPNFGNNTITGITATQSANDNTTKLASTAFVQTAISNLIDSSPDALNTLNELAAALGDDADFSTTITTALAAKAPLANPTFSGTVSGISYNDLDDLPSGSNLTTEQVQDIVGAMVTGNTETGITVTYNDAGDGTGKLNFATTTSSSSSQTFDDNVKAIFGTSNDGLEIYHDGNNSIIDDTGTGDLLLFGTSIKLQRTNSTPESLMIEAFGGNAVKLYYDGALKFETQPSGAKWFGDLFCDDNSKIKLGSAGDLQIYHDEDNSIIDDSGTGSLLVYGSNVIIQESGTSNVMADFHPNTVKLYKNNKEKLITTDNGIEIKGDSSSSTDGSIQLNCSANSHGVKIKSPNHSAGQSYTIILPDNQIAVNKILKVKSISGSGSTAIGQLEFADDTDTVLPTASSSTLGGIKVGTNLSIDGNGVLSASTGTTVGGANGVSFNDDIRIIFGGTTNEKLELFYNASVNRGIITANTGVHLQFDGSTKIESVNAGVKWHGDLFCDDSISGDVNKIKLGNSDDLEIYHDSNNSIIDGTGTGALLLYGEDIIFHEKSDASNRMADFAQDGSTGVRLYYDNAVKLQTISTGLSVTGNITSTGNLTISNTAPAIFLNDTDSENDFNIQNINGTFVIADIDAGLTRLEINSSGVATFRKNLNALEGLDVTGNITVTGTVDGRDVAADGTKLDGIASNANNYSLPTASSSTLGGIKVGTNLSIDGNGVLSASTSSVTASDINAAFPDNGNLILGTGSGDDTLKLYYDGTNGFITADNGVQLQYDGSTKFLTQSTGVKWVGDLFCDDSQFLKLGSSADLQIYHDGSNSYIDDTGTGALLIKSNTLYLTGTNAANDLASFVEGGAVSLYHDNSKKFETKSYGIEATGGVYPPSNDSGQLGGSSLRWSQIHANDFVDLPDYGKIQLGNSDDLEIYHDGSNSIIDDTGTGGLLIYGSDIILHKTGTAERMADFAQDGAVRLYNDNQIKFETTSTGIDVTGAITGTADAIINSIAVGKGANSVAGNTVLGENALDAAVTGGNNTAIGLNALTSNTSGSSNTAIGKHALATNTTGSTNTAVGQNALKDNSTGTHNTGLGHVAGENITTGTKNTCVGSHSLDVLTTGSFNTAVGQDALGNTTTADSNTAVGQNALFTNIDGHSNVAIGSYALDAANTNNNTAVGHQAMTNSTASECVAVGSRALKAHTSGARNTAVGSEAAATVTTGSDITAIGRSCLAAGTGSNNTGLGSKCLITNTSGHTNTAVGQNAMLDNTTGSNNVAVGADALDANTTGNQNVAIGKSALTASNSNQNTAVGFEAGMSITSGSGNDCFGRATMGSVTTGSDNCAFGKGSLKNLTTGNGNVALGDISAVATRLYNVTTEHDRLILGHHNITNAYIKVALTVTSDERDKIDFSSVPHGLDFVNKLKPKSFWFRRERGSDQKDGCQHYGFIAQDILALEGENPVIIDNEQEEHLKYKGEHLLPVLVNAIKELSAKVTALEAG